jgi:hypothetical protein
MGESLRTVLAELDVSVRGLGKIDAANASVDRYLATVTPAVAKIEQLRIEQQLASEMAGRLAGRMRQLQKSEGDNSTQIEGLRKAMVRAREAAFDFGRQAETLRKQQAAAAESASRGGFANLVSGVKSALVEIGVAIAATEGMRRLIDGVYDATLEVAKQGEDLHLTSIRLGISTQALQEWQFVAERTGVSAETLEGSIRRMTRNAAGPGAKAFQALGVHTRDASGALLSQEQIFSNSITQLAGLRNQTQRAAMAQRLFGKSGTQLLPLVAEGAAGVAELRKRFHELGGGIQDDVIKDSVDAEHALTDFREAWTSLRSVLVAKFIPALAAVAEKVATWIGAAVELIRTSSVMQVVLGTLAVAAVATGLAFLPIIAPMLILIALFAALFLGVEDVVTAFRGGDSAFGAFIDRLFKAIGITETFRGAIAAVGAGWHLAIASALDALAMLGDGLNKVQRLLGVHGITFDSQTLRDAAAGARADATQSANASAQTLLPAAAMPVGNVFAGRRPGSKVTQLNTIQIHGITDPEAVGRAVDRHLTDRMREASDTLPDADDEVEQ